MPVGTKATVKGGRVPIASQPMGARVVLANTYHLYFRPGAELVAAHGGLHGFMGWDGPILTDSGGFQVFSLADTRVDRRRRRRVRLGLRRLAPRVHAREGDRDPGAARRRHRDVLRRVRAGDALGASRSAPPSPARLAGRAPAAKRRRATTSCSSASSRAASTRRCAAARPPTCWRSTSPPTRSAVCRWGRGTTRCCATVSLLDGLLPEDRFRYFMGIGDPVGVLDVIERGVDLFDCVLPTRLARTGTAFTSAGRVNLRNARFADDLRAARRRLRRSLLPDVHARLPPPPRQPEGDPRACSCSASTTCAF